MSIPITIKIVQPPAEPRCEGTARQDFDPNDATELTQYAQKTNTWQTLVASGQYYDRVNVEALCAISDLNGRIAVWYGVLTRLTTQTRVTPPSRATPNNQAIAEAALLNTDDMTEHRRRFRAGQLWVERFTHSGLRDITPLALAACRVLHAHAFDEVPAERDYYLAEMLDFKHTHRPNTPTILAASTDALAAASTMLMLGKHVEASELLKSTRISRVRELQMYKPYWEKP